MFINRTQTTILMPLYLYNSLPISSKLSSCSVTSLTATALSYIDKFGGIHPLFYWLDHTAIHCGYNIKQNIYVKNKVSIELISVQRA